MNQLQSRHRQVLRWQGIELEYPSCSAVKLQVSFEVICSSSVLTNSILDLPSFLTLKGYETSRPVVESFNSRNAWCGRFALRSSCAVRMTLRESDSPREMGVGRGTFSLRLHIISI